MGPRRDLGAGSDRGTWFIPQVDDEVLVAFEQGDVRTPYVLGSLWNATDKPPAERRTTPIGRRIVKTPAGHVIELDDTKQSITITSSTRPEGDDHAREDRADGGRRREGTLETPARSRSKATTTISATRRVDIEAEGHVNLELDGDASATLKAGATCTGRRAPGEDQLMPPAARVGDLTGHPGHDRRDRRRRPC